MFEIPVFSELYGVTVAIASAGFASLLHTKYLPCADGTDYQLTRHEKEQLAGGIEENEFKASNDLAYPFNLIALCEPNNNRIDLPRDYRFDIQDFNAVKKVLVKAGGKYAENGFVFKRPGVEVYDLLLNLQKTNLQKVTQFFPTPDEIADDLVALAELDEFAAQTILEPEAGDGQIVRAIQRALPTPVKVFGYEFDEGNRRELELIPEFNLLGADFLSCGITFDRIIANPPFSGNQDIIHIRKMYECLNEKGVLVSVTSTHFRVSKKKTETAFREWLEEKRAAIIEVPAGSFKASGTNVETVIIKIRK